MRSVGTLKTSKNHVSPRGHYCGGLVYLAGTVLWVGRGLRAVWIPGFDSRILGFQDSRIPSLASRDRD